METEQCANGQAPSDMDPQSEGAKKIRQHVVYERSKNGRADAIKIHGRFCKACKFDFNGFYGPEHATGYIEVHHVDSITSGPKVIDPAKGLVPLCANCHRMVHRKKGETLPVDDLKRIIEKAQSRRT